MGKKQTLIFDASIFAEHLKKGLGRSGIYFTAYNILKKLIKSNQFQISLYANIFDEKFVDFVKENFGSNIKIYSGNQFSMYLKKLSDLDVKLRKSGHNISKLLLNVFVRKPLRLIGQNVRLPYFDIAFSPRSGFSPRIKAGKKYILVHDVIPLVLPEYAHHNSKKSWFNALIKYIKSNPKCKYFANSQATKNDFVKYAGVNPDDIVVTLLAADSGFYPVTDTKKITNTCAKYHIPKHTKYIFSLCTLEPRKNLIRAVKTFIEFIKKNNIDNLVFVLGGGHWDKFIDTLKSEISDLGKYKDKIIRAGYIDDKDLATLYSGAEWFVYTSQYEGFGLPPLEAMQCGCPVITSNNSSLPEVVGDAGIMIDWDSDTQHIAAYEKYYNNPKLRQKMQKQGLLHAHLFSWNRTTRLMIKEMTKDNF